MDVESFQTASQGIVVLGILLTAVGGFGSYYFGKKAEEGRQAGIRASFETELSDLQSTLEPFLELARQARPEADSAAALAGLREDIEELRSVAAKHEFTPLSPETRTALVGALQRLALEYKEANMTVLITHETWTGPATRRYADQLALLLHESGIRVRGPDQITYFLITPSSPIEWGYHDSDLDRVGKLFEALLPVMGSSEKWTKRAHQKKGFVRIHFGGEVVFGKNGLVEVQ